jgi:hypothetical protein
LDVDAPVQLEPPRVVLLDFNAAIDVTAEAVEAPLSVSKGSEAEAALALGSPSALGGWLAQALN